MVDLSLNVTTISLALVMSLATAVLSYGAILLATLQPRGGLERILVRSVLDRKNRRTVVLGFSVVAGVVVTEGALSSLSDLQLMDNRLVQVASAAIFGIGSITLLYLIRTPLRHTDLTLEEELDLRDARPEIFSAVAAATGIGGIGPTPLFLAFPLEQSRLLAVRALDADASAP